MSSSSKGSKFCPKTFTMQILGFQFQALLMNQGPPPRNKVTGCPHFSYTNENNAPCLRSRAKNHKTLNQVTYYDTLRHQPATTTNSIHHFTTPPFNAPWTSIIRHIHPQLVSILVPLAWKQGRPPDHTSTLHNFLLFLPLLE